MPRKLTDKRDFPVGSAQEALALSQMLAASLVPLVRAEAAKTPNTRSVLSGRISGGTIQVETGVVPIEHEAIRNLYEEADAEAIEAANITILFMLPVIPQVYIHWTSSHGGVTVSVDTPNVGWGHEVLDLAERVVKAGRPIGLKGAESAPFATPSLAVSAAPTQPAPAPSDPVVVSTPAPSSGTERVAAQPERRIPVWARWVGGVVTAVVVTVVGGGILKALGWV